MSEQQFNDLAVVRLKQIVGDADADPPISPLIPVSPSTWWGWVASGRAPAPIKLGDGTTVWRVSDIRQFVSGQGNDANRAANRGDRLARARKERQALSAA